MGGHTGVFLKCDHDRCTMTQEPHQSLMDFAALTHANIKKHVDSWGFESSSEDAREEAAGARTLSRSESGRMG
jgi:hypothetical protein